MDGEAESEPIVVGFEREASVAEVGVFTLSTLVVTWIPLDQVKTPPSKGSDFKSASPPPSDPVEELGPGVGVMLAQYLTQSSCDAVSQLITTGVGAAEFWPELLEHAIRASGTRASTVSRRIGPFCDTSQTRAATSLDLQLAPFCWACDNDCAFGSAPASCAAQLDPLRGHDAVISVSDGWVAR